VGSAFFLRGVHTLGGSSSLAFDSSEVVFFLTAYEEDLQNQILTIESQNTEPKSISAIASINFIEHV
jgi:hypothetical protein